MRIRRSTLVTLTGLVLEDYKSRLRRDLLPFPDADGFEYSKWREFLVAHAVLIELSTMLYRDGGVSLAVARSAISNQAGQIYDRLAQAESGHVSAAPFIYAGIVQGNDTDNISSTIHIVGTLAEIGDSLHGRELRRRADETPGGPWHDRIFLADIGKAIATVRMRAHDGGIELPVDVSDWTQ